MTRTALLRLLMASAAMAAPCTALAQETSLFARDRAVSVRERPRPDYEAFGLPIGSFILLPRVGLDAAYSDNIFATRTATTSDFIYRLRPDVTLQSNWSRHEAAAYGRASVNRFADNPSENTTDHTVGVRGQLDLGRASYISANLFDALSTDPRSSPNTPSQAASPTRFGSRELTVTGLHRFSRLQLKGKVTRSDIDYRPVPRIGGGSLFLDFRDRASTVLFARADYALTPATAVYATVAANERNYKLELPVTNIDRDSRGYEATVGVNFELSALFRGEIEAGYLTQDYENTAYKAIDGLALRGSIDYFPTQLTSVNITVSRSLEEAVANGASGYMATVVGGRIDHELRRNVLLSATGSLEQDDFNGIDRMDYTLLSGVSATYLLNRRVGVTATYNYLDRKSDGTSRNLNFTENRFTGTLTLQF